MLPRLLSNEYGAFIERANVVQLILDAYGCTVAADNVMLGVEIAWRVELQHLVQEAHDQRARCASLTCPFGPLTFEGCPGVDGWHAVSDEWAECTSTSWGVA